MKVMIIGVSLVALPLAASDPAPKKIPGKEQQKKLVNKVAPVYPADAKEKGLSGKVRLQAIINKDGTVKELKVISGEEIFVAPTLAAVKQWTYEPTKINNELVEVVTDIDVNFVLSN
jgi:protein TonB